MRPVIGNPKRKARHRSGFVFLATLGVMAVAILIAFAMSSATQITYSMTDRAIGEVQVRLMAQSATDYALLLIAQKKMTPDGKPQPFRIANDSLRGSAVVGVVAAIELPPSAAIYRLEGVRHVPGDVLVGVVSHQMYERFGHGECYWLCNLAGQRTRPIDLTRAPIDVAEAFKQASAK